MKIEDIKKVLILGGGTMGQQIASVCAIHGFDVVIYDVKLEMLEKALSRVRRLIEGHAARGLFDKSKIEEFVKRVTATDKAEEAAKDVDLISESVPEDPELKGKVFSTFHRLCPAHTVFTTNTSTLLPSQFAEATGRPERLIALHFHDVRITDVVDVMPHPGTLPELVPLVTEFAVRIGQVPIVLKKENNGYVFNAMITALMLSAQTLAANDVASIEDIDRAWMGVTRMFSGPFGIMDSIGIDTVYKVTDYWAKVSKKQQNIKNAEFLRAYVDKGFLGTKTKKGFYTYPNPEFSRPGFLKGFKND